MSNDVINENILNSIKRLLGIHPDITSFDQDVLLHINSVFSILAQVGVGPATGFTVNTDTNWTDFLSNLENPQLYADVKTFVYLKVKLMFDPPTSSTIMDSFERNIKEIEYRLYTQAGGY